MRVNNLHYNVTEEELKKMFEEFGRVRSCKIIWDKADRSTGQAVIEYENPRNAD